MVLLFFQAVKIWVLLKQLAILKMLVNTIVLTNMRVIVGLLMVVTLQTLQAGGVAHILSQYLTPLLFITEKSPLMTPTEDALKCLVINAHCLLIQKQ